ncbi:dedicator of cytokinesis 1 isoform X2 [Brachionus plicatilis]|uniref:Dedicator of cytokinesis 1 isoform X2 n=1 Tax=Brachionus plicatilis TaxID=10195 RepID=A0A3M7T0R1_BRAPC|nr:dedicator of cytokinesis 1 isoform X2 [Brachionus plicatilis]
MSTHFENAYFQMDDLINTKNLTNIQHSANSFQRTTLTDNNEKFVFFCDISEKDFEYTKKGYKLLLVVYSVKHTSVSEFDSSIVSPKNIIENLNIKEVHDLKNSRSINKDMFFTLTFRIELFELSYKNIINKYGHIHPKICRKMNFPEIIMPDDYRNEFFITIVGAEFQKARNYELIINVVQIREENNKKIEDPSMVYFKQDKPKWNEIVKPVI